MLAVALSLMLQRPVVEIRDYAVQASLGSGGKMTLTRIYEPERRVVSLRSITTWDDKSTLDERWVYDVDGVPTLYTHVIEREAKKFSSSVKIEKGKGAKHWESESGLVTDNEFTAPKERYADPSVWWFVSAAPEAGEVVKTTRIMTMLPDESVKVIFVGKKKLKSEPNGPEYNLVQRIVGESSPRIDSYCDDTGMPVLREYYSSGAQSPYRVDSLIRRK